MQTTSQLLMIKPVNFSFNAETAVNNAFQQNISGDQTQQEALDEFNNFASTLRAQGVTITVIDDTPDPYTPDSIFPNNWISFHDNGVICLYPMYAQNRRLERKSAILHTLSELFVIGETIDLSPFENNGLFLEGTGSMVLDRDNRIAYACLSPRTNEEPLRAFCEKMRYSPVTFTSVDGKGQPVYHTNVMMCVADRYAVVCLNSIPDPHERQFVRETLERTGKECITIGLDQMNRFAGNMLQVHNDKGEKLLVMSSQAFDSLQTEQIEKLSGYNRIIHAPLTIIETNGGGSARCMLAEIYLSKQRQVLGTASV